MMAEEASILRIRLTPEELAVLFQEATGPEAEAPTDDILPNYSEEQLGLVLDVALRGLIARELLHPDGEGGVTLHSLAIGIVGCSLLADGSVTIRSQAHGGEIRRREFQAHKDEVWLAHAETEEGLHMFDFFVDESAYHQAILAAPQFGQLAALACPPGELSLESFDRVLASASGGDGKKVAAQLGDSPLAEKTATHLARTLEGPYELKTITAIDKVEGSVSKEDGLTFIQSQDGLWQVGVETQGKGTVSIQSLSAEESLEKVQALVGLS